MAGVGGMYHYEATSIEGFVQQLAVSYLKNGYWFYVTGTVPEKKSAEAIDRKLIERYDIDMSKWARARRKELGLANMQYIRFRRFFVLLATHGEHPFFEREKNNIRDARKTPIRFFGYSISYRGGHPHVRINLKEFKWLKSYFTDLASHRAAGYLERELAQIRFEPYSPVRRQLLIILRAVNEARKRAGYELVSHECLRFKRRICRPFDLPELKKIA